jgi:predicted small lipoprotein YifL
MKKFVLFTVLTFALAACGSKKTEEVPTAEVIDEEEIVTKVVTDTTTENVTTEGSEKNK